MKNINLISRTIKLVRPLTSSILALLTLVLTTSACYCGNSNNNPADDETASEEPSEVRFSLLIAGDLMQHMPQIKAALQSDGSYNYDECFAGIRDEVENADVAIANFETTLAGPPYSGFPQFSAPDDFLRGVINAGFDILLTANNHCVDTRKKGLERTLKMMDSLRVEHLGTYRNKAEREKNYPYLMEKDGLRIVLLNFTYGTNGLPVPTPCHVNLMDTTEIAADLKKAKAMNPDVIIALPHWGTEYQTLPSSAQKKMAKWLMDHGVDHIIGGHPHVAQPIELLNDRQNVIAWSMGNVVSNQSKPNTYGGYMVRLEFAKYDSTTVLIDHDYSLYWVSRPTDNGRRHNYRILPIDYPDSLLTTTEKSLRSAIRKSMRQLMKEHGKGEIKEKVL